MEKKIGETGQYDDITFKVVERHVDENNPCACIGCVFSLDYSPCGRYTRESVREIMGVCSKEDRSDGKSVIFVDANNKYTDTEEFRQYILKHVPTEILLKEYKHKMPFVYKGRCDMDSGPYISSHEGCWDPRCHIVIGKFASWNPFKGHSFNCYYTLSEAKDELNMREHVKRYKGIN